MANSIFVTAVSFGVGAANLTSIMNQKIGWRNSALACSSFGVVVAILLITIEEPKRIDCTAN
jgi:predicted MFS family arabinose efflux permease